MANKPSLNVSPIVGPDGKPYYASEGEIIGAEQVNAWLRWSREHNKHILSEHDRDGFHHRAFHCIGVARVVFPYNNGHADISPRSEYKGKTVEQDPYAISVFKTGVGAGYLNFWEPLPQNLVVIANAYGNQMLSFSYSVSGNRLDVSIQYNGGAYGDQFDLFLYGK